MVACQFNVYDQSWEDMAKITCALERGARERLTITWKPNWQDVSIILDNQPLWTFANVEELKTGKSFKLDDGRTLQIQLLRRYLRSKLSILLDGQPLPDSAADPLNRFTLAYSIVFFIGGLNALLGLASILLQNSFLQSMGLGFFSIIYCAFFIGLGFSIKNRSQAALVIAVVLFIINSLLSIGLKVLDSQIPNPAGIIGRIFLLIPMIQGIHSIPKLPVQAEKKD